MSRTCEKLGGDGTTCIPGCYPSGQQCHEVMHDWQCSFPPEYLCDALEAQLNRRSYKQRNNEMIVNAAAFEHMLPQSVEAFFLLKGASDQDQSWVRRARKTFLEQYRLSEWDGPPLVELDLRDDGLDTPFQRAQTGVELTE